MSPDNTYLRFFSLSSSSAGREAMRICREPDGQHAALLAWRGSRLVGVASYEPTTVAGTAEIAFAVPDDMHRHGIATLLLEHLVSLARLRGVAAFTAQTLPDNAAMLRVFADAGLPVTRHFSDGEVALTFPLPGGGSDLTLDSYLQSVAGRESRAGAASLRSLLNPASVAVIGVSRRPDSIGHAVVRNLVAGGFAGKIYVVSPHARTVAGLPCVASVADLPAAVDLAVIAVPAAAVPQVAADCGSKGVRALTVVTSGLGTESADLLAICRRYGMRLAGPNCLGVLVPGRNLNATFAAAQAAPGVAGVVVQSGGVGIAIMDHLSRLGIGVSSFASVGDKFDVSSNDMLMWWEQDQVTRLAVLYVESFGSPRKFARTARRVGQQIPVLTVIGGRSAAARRAAQTAAAAAASPLAGRAALVTLAALFEQAGVIAARSLGELVETAALLSCQPLPAGDRVAIVTNAGGAGVLAADACAESGLRAAQLSAATQRRLRALLPAGAGVDDLVDTTPAVSRGTFVACLEQVAADDGVDAVIAVTVPTGVSVLTGAITAAAITAAANAKPVAAVLLGQAESVRLLPRHPAAQDPAAAADPAAAGREEIAAARRAPAVDGIPAYAFPEGAARALGHALRYRAWRDRQGGVVPDLTGLHSAAARELVAGFLASAPDGGWLTAGQAAALLSCYQIPLVTTVTAGDESQAISAAARLGGRVVLKAQAGGQVPRGGAAVRPDLRTPAAVAHAYRQLAASFGDGLDHVLVQPMIAGGVEVMAGVVQEPIFGPLVILGPGGPAAGLLADCTARLTPLTRADADDLIAALPAAALPGRGYAPGSHAALADLLLRISRLADDLPEVAELELSPVLALADGPCPVGARIQVRPARARDPFLRQLR